MKGSEKMKYKKKTNLNTMKLHWRVVCNTRNNTICKKSGKFWRQKMSEEEELQEVLHE